MHLLNFCNRKEHKRYGLLKLNIMNDNFDNKILYVFWNGPIIYDVLVRDLILIR